MDVSANQRLDEEETDHEVFQMEFQPQEQKWCFRTVDNKLWKLEPIGGIQASVDRLYVTLACGCCRCCLFIVFNRGFERLWYV